MKEPNIVMQLDPPRAWVETVERGVDQHNVAATGQSDYYPVVFVAKEPSGAIVGGLIGDIWGGWMYIDLLWVSGRWRGRGLATCLMAEAEAYARRKQCGDSFLDTGSFEARPFYEKLGYKVYAELEDHPTAGQARYFLEKRLPAAAARMRRPEGVELEMNPYASERMRTHIQEGISSHAYAALGLPEPPWLYAGFFARDAAGEIVGGALGNTWGRWLYVSFLWVDRPSRGRGLATRLIAAIEKHAKGIGCAESFLGTFSFQARPLYEKLGYRVFGERENHPAGHSHYLLRRRLTGTKR